MGIREGSDFFWGYIGFRVGVFFVVVGVLDESFVVFRGVYFLYIYSDRVDCCKGCFFFFWWLSFWCSV